MDNNEGRNDRQIQLVVNRPETDETTIDLGNVFYNMKRLRYIFAWLLVLCLLVGICIPLLLYQFTKPRLTVSSVVTLRERNPPDALTAATNSAQRLSN